MSDGAENQGRMARRILRQIRPFWPQILLLLLIDLLATPLLLLTPVPLKIAVDSVIGSDPLPGFVDPFVPGSLPGAAAEPGDSCSRFRVAALSGASAGRRPMRV